jgi:hypothetical protein
MYQLKCKAIALAEESKAFKKQEQREKRLYRKWKAAAAAGKAKFERNLTVYNGIRDHRLMMVRKEARCSLLAYGFLKGLKYQEMENFSWSQPNWDRVEKLALRYANRSTEQDIKQTFAQWRDEALNGVKPKWSDTVVPGSIGDLKWDPEWVHMQNERNGKHVWLAI